MSAETSSRKRSIASFFGPATATKRARLSPAIADQEAEGKVDAVSAKGSDNAEADIDERGKKPASQHASYPHPIAALPSAILDALDHGPAAEARAITDKPDLDLLYYKPYVPASIQHALFAFLRAELPFYRVRYSIKRGGTETTINTPRYTTVFGVDATSTWTAVAGGGGAPRLLDAATLEPVPGAAYRARPRPLPACLDALRRSTEAMTGAAFNFCLVNYYASGDDSISYHSDDERFLGERPCIASFSLGGARDFLMRHKDKAAHPDPRRRDLKLELGSGDMLLMRGTTQAKWLHSIPKRKGASGERGRINITFRRALVKGGTENYYRYNVGDGQVFRWDEARREMRAWRAGEQGAAES